MLLGTFLARSCRGTAAVLRAAGRTLPRAISSLHEAFPGVPRIGLINEHATDEVFTTKLDFSTVDALLTDRAQLLAAVDEDAKALGVSREEYLEAVRDAVREFVESNELCDREEVEAAMSAVMNDGKGNFAMLLGGKNTGKSLILRKLAERRRKQQKDSVLLINARTSGANLTQGIVQALSPDDRKAWADALLDVGKAGISAAGALVGMPAVAEFAVGAFLDPVQKVILAPKQGVTAVTLINKFVDVHNKKGRTACIIIDEANRALQNQNEAFRTQTMDVLELFTQLTKEEKKLNVLLACSEHAEPYRLRQLGFNTHNFTEKIFAGEVPPRKMLEQLKKLKVGDNLAGLLVGIYGGHIWTLYLAVSKLLAARNFTPIRALPSGTTSKVVRCVRAEEANEPGMGGMRELLQELAETGFAPLVDEEDLRAERLSRDNIAGVVSSSAVTVGIPPHLWRGKDYGLVPATHFTRLQIARALNQMK